MKSTEKLHSIVESMPEEDRQAMMRDLRELRLLVAHEVTGAMRNANKMVQLLYGDNGYYHSQGK